MRIDRLHIAALVALAPAGALAQAPMSAIDWLSDSVAAEPELAAPARPDEAPVTRGAAPEIITVTPLDGVSADAVGLLPASVTGLPRDLWGPSRSAEIAALIAGLDPDLLPALQSLVISILLAELDPPLDSDPDSRLFLARIDALLARGAVDQAQALLDRAGPDSPAFFRRWFDASLLNGTEQASCERLGDSADLSPTLMTRIFCLARLSDWNAAALTLDTSRALGDLGEYEVALLDRFLDIEAFEDAAVPSPPATPTPLEYRIFEAIGEPLATATLPLAYAHHDLSPNAGWRAQIIAAERLARTGAVPANLLLGLYTDRKPAASGGVWERVAAVQALDEAVQARDADAVAASLPRAWREMRARGLEVVLATLYAPRLGALPLPEDTARVVFRIAMLSDLAEASARAYAPSNRGDRFLVSVATGTLSEAQPTSSLERTIKDGFTAERPAPALQALLDQGALGAAILRAVALANEGALGDLDKLASALALFRAVGLEGVARRTALQALILDMRG